MCCEAHNDLHRPRGSSPLQLLIGRTPKGVGLEAERSLGQRSAEITDAVERSRLEVKTECYKAYVEEELSIQQNRKALHQTRKWRSWASGEWCWYWRSSTADRKRTPKAGVFRGPARVLMQERDVTAEGSKLRGVVWVADGASMVRVSPSHLRTLSDAEKTHAVKFLDLIEKHHRASLLDELPEPFRDERKEGDEACQEPKTLAALVSVMLYGQRARGGAPGYSVEPVIAGLDRDGAPLSLIHI